MNADQTKRLETLAEQIAEEFIIAATPGNWTGDGERMQDMSPNTRGARNWDVKNANIIGSLLARTLDLRDRVPDMPDDMGEEAEKEAAKYAAQAAELVKRVREKQH